jgi:hypothetical protein
MSLTKVTYSMIDGTLVNAKDFGAVGDGIADDTAAIQAAISYVQSVGSGTVTLPQGVYKITSTILIQDVPVILEGQGSGQPNSYYSPGATGTVLKWAGAVNTGPVVKFQDLKPSFGMKKILIDCNNLAWRGLTLSNVQHGIFTSIGVLNIKGAIGADGRGISLICEGTYIDPVLSIVTETVSWNTFTDIEVTSGMDRTIGIYVSGNLAVGGGNSCHNTFINTAINYAGDGSVGLLLGYCDNNNFVDTYIFKGGGNGYGVQLVPEIGQPLFPVNNTFFHLQASTGGLYANAGAPTNTVIGYANDNGQPEPVRNGTYQVVMETSGRLWPMISVSGIFNVPGTNLGGGVTFLAGQTTQTVNLQFTEPNGNYAVFLTPGSQPIQTFWVTSKTATTFVLNASAAPAGDIYFDYFIVRL